MPNQREIFLIPFPYSDLETEKTRPALVLSNSVFNSQFDEILVMGITSNLETPLPGLEVDTSDCEFGLLPRRSRILVSKLWAIEKSRVGPFLARLRPGTFQRVLNEFGKVIR